MNECICFQSSKIFKYIIINVNGPALCPHHDLVPEGVRGQIIHAASCQRLSV